MVEIIRHLQKVLSQLEQRLKAAKGIQLGSGQARTALREFVDDYFRNVRETVRVDLADENLLPCDAALQSLLEATQHKTTVRVYRKILKQIRAALDDLEMAALIPAAGKVNSTAGSIEDVDQRIVDTLQKTVPSAALSYKQAVLDLQSNSRLSWRGPATDLREALRECLDHLAPDTAVRSQVGFKMEPGGNGPTMKQKVRFILKSRGVSRSASETPEAAVDLVDEAVGTFVRSVYTRSSVSTHTPTAKVEVLRVRAWVREALCELLELR